MSFTAVSLATGSRAGWRTLLVDCDPQGNATTMFDPDDDVEFDLYDCIKTTEEDLLLHKVIRQTRVDNLDLLPSTWKSPRLSRSSSRDAPPRVPARDGLGAGCSTSTTPSSSTCLPTWGRL